MSSHQKEMWVDAKYVKKAFLPSSYSGLETSDLSLVSSIPLSIAILITKYEYKSHPKKNFPICLGFQFFLIVFFR